MEHYVPRPYLIVLIWTIGVLLGMIGLGRLVAKFVAGKSAAEAGWGLHAIFGMSAYVFLGGVLAVFGAATDIGITLLISLGLVALVLTTRRAGNFLTNLRAALPWQMWPVYVVGVVCFFGGLVWQFNVNSSDDLPAYHAFCEKLLTTGSFDEPFSWRRLASLGGQTLLQCSVLSQGSFANAQAFEIALCPWILVGLVIGFRGGALARSPIGLLLALVAVSTPIIRANTTSHFTGVVLLTGLFIALDLADRAGAERRRWLVAAGLIAAAACTLRAIYVPAAVGTLGIYWLASWLRDRRPAREALLEGSWWIAVVFVALLPWMVMGYRSNASPLFPLFQGSNNLAFNPQSLDEPLHKRLLELVRMLLHPGLLPLLCCLLLIPDWKRALAARSVAIAAILASMALAYSISLAPDELTVPRYVQPLFLAAAMAALMTAAMSRRGSLAAGALALFVVVSTFDDRRQHLWFCYKAIGEDEPGTTRVPPLRVAEHLKAQAMIPEGKRILVCTDTPYLFDHRRNPIWISDLPHAASPAPGLPFQSSPEETKRYLHHLGVDYVIYENFDAAYFYGRGRRQHEGEGTVPLLKIWAPFFLDYFTTLEQLSASEAPLGKTARLVVFQFKS